MSEIPVLRAGRDADAAGFITLVDACWAEYPGCVMDLDGEVPELRALATYYTGQGGALWAAEQAGAIVGMVATRKLDDEAWELCKMYVAAAQRGTGIAHALAQAVETHARAQGAGWLRLWTDTRFDRAHRFYEKLSFVRAGPLRALNDKSHSIEFAYAKPLRGIVVQALDIAAAAAAETRLATILRDCVDGGASVSFLPPLALETARLFWRGLSPDIAAGRRILLAAWVDGDLAGTAMLEFAMAANQPHRAEVQKLLVHPDARRRGVGRALTQAIEAAARTAGRSLLVMNTRAGDGAEALLRSSGWQEGGRIPEFALNAAGGLDTAVIFYKQLA